MSKNNTARALIKQLADRAKQRMKNADYGAEKDNAYTRKIRVVRACNPSKPDITIKIVDSQLMEDNFYNQVCAMLDENMDIVNPMSKLINKSQFENLSAFDQEKFILDMSEKYAKARNLYIKKHAMNE